MKLFKQLIFLLFFLSTLIVTFSSKEKTLAFTCSTTTTTYKCADSFNFPAIQGCTLTDPANCNPSCPAPAGASKQSCYSCPVPATWQCPDGTCGTGFSCNDYNYYTCNNATQGCDLNQDIGSPACISNCPTPTPIPTPTPTPIPTPTLPPLFCSPGSTLTCTTPDNCPGTETCNSSGSGYNSCVKNDPSCPYHYSCSGSACILNPNGQFTNSYCNNTCPQGCAGAPTYAPQTPTTISNNVTCDPVGGSSCNVNCTKSCTDIYGNTCPVSGTSVWACQGGSQWYNDGTCWATCPYLCNAPPVPTATPAPVQIRPWPGGVCTYTTYTCPSSCSGGGTYRATNQGQCISHDCDTKCFCDQYQSGPPGCYDQNNNYCGQPYVENHYCTISQQPNSTCVFPWYQPYQNTSYCGNEAWECYCPSWALGYAIPTNQCSVTNNQGQQSVNSPGYGPSYNLSYCHDVPFDQSTCGPWSTNTCGTQTRTCQTTSCQTCTDTKQVCNCNYTCVTPYNQNGNVYNSTDGCGQPANVSQCNPVTVSGNVFVDLNQNHLKDNGETNYTGTINVSSSNGAPVIEPPGTGTYSVYNLIPGTYTIYYNNLPPGYSMTYPLNGPSPSFTVTVGSGICSVGGSNSASCDGSGNITNLNFGISYNKPWIQCKGADCRVDSGFTSKIPSTAVGGAYASLNGGGGTPGLIFTGNSSPDFGQGQPSTTGWVVGGIINGETYTPTQVGGTIKTSYSYLYGKAQQANITPTDISSYCSGGISNCTLSSSIPHGVYVANGNLKLVGSGFTFPNNQNFVILVNGDLTISEKLFVPNGSTTLFSASGNIFVDQSVGETTASSASTDIEGIFSSDKSFIAQGTNSCSVGNDLRLNIGGSVITNAGGTGGSFQYQRDLCGNDPYYPVIYFLERPDFTLNSPQFLQQPNFTYQEIAP